MYVCGFIFIYRPMYIDMDIYIAHKHVPSQKDLTNRRGLGKKMITISQVHFRKKAHFLS